MELQDNLDKLRDQNVEPYAISYDPVSTLSTFADKHGITYPLLSDSDSRVMRAFGIFNASVPKDHRWYGIPYPGTYMVDEHGVVFDKTFYADHVARDSIARMVQDVYGIDTPHGTVHEIETAAYTIRVYLSANTIRRGQVHTLTVDLDVHDGFHVQAAPLPEGYIPFDITPDAPEGVKVESFANPEPRPFRLPGLDDQLHIYEGRVSFQTSVLFNVRENVVLPITVEIQACTDRDCLLPETHLFELSTEWLPNP